jgi:sugar lactone lactonase YvrE
MRLNLSFCAAGWLSLVALASVAGCGGGSGPTPHLAGDAGSPPTRQSELHRFDVNVQTGKVSITKVDPTDPTRAILTGGAVSFTSSDLLAVAGDAGKRVVRLNIVTNLGPNESTTVGSQLSRLVLGNLTNSNTVNFRAMTQVEPYTGDGTAGSTDGLLAAARFNAPQGLAAGDGPFRGSIYVADRGTHIIRRIAPEGSVTTIAGSAGVAGSVDGVGSAARFNGPTSCAMDSNGNLFVATFDGNTIHFITPLGQVSRICNIGGALGDANGQADQNGMLRRPIGLAVSRDGNRLYISEDVGRIKLLRFTNTSGSRGDAANYTLSEIASGGKPGPLALREVGFSSETLYFADQNNHNIWAVENPQFSAQIYPITTGGTPGSTDGAGSQARFDQPFSITVLPEQFGDRFWLLVGNVNAPRLRAIQYIGGDLRNTGNYRVVTLAGDGTAGNVDGNGTTARFNLMRSLLAVPGTPPSATAFVAQSDHRIRRITFNLNTLTSGIQNGTATEPVRLLNGDEVPNVTPVAYYVQSGGQNADLQFYVPNGVLAFSFTVYLESDTNYVNLPAADSVFTTTVIGASAGGVGVPGVSDGPGKLGQLRNPLGIVSVPPFLRGRYGGDARAFVVDSNSGRLRSLSVSGYLGQFSGSVGFFLTPYGLAIAPDGSLWMTEAGRHRIWRITPEGTGNVVAGTGVAGSGNGAGNGATFNFPTGITVDAGGNVFVTDTGNHTIRQIRYNSGAPNDPASYQVTTVCGSPGAAGNTNALGAAARFNGPRGIVADTDGALFVADTSNHTIRRLTRDTAGSGQYNAALLSGLALTAGTTDGTGTAARHNLPLGIALDNAHNVYVTDFSSHRIRRVSPQGQVVTLAGSTAGFTDGLNGQFNNPAGIAVDANGNLLIADFNNHAIRTVQRYINQAYSR